MDGTRPGEPALESSDPDHPLLRGGARHDDGFDDGFDEGDAGDAGDAGDGRPARGGRERRRNRRVLVAALVLLIVPVLAIGGYRPQVGMTADGPRNPALTEIILAFTIVPAVFFVISLALLRGYRLTGEDVEARLSDDDIPAGAGDSSEAVDPVDAGALEPRRISPNPVVEVGERR